MTRDEMRDWRVQDVAKDIVETHAQATPRDWGSPDHALYKLIVAKLVAERDRIAALRSRPAPPDVLVALVRELQASTEASLLPGLTLRQWNAVRALLAWAAPAPVAAPAPLAGDREATCAWDCTQPYPHQGTCSAPAPETPAPDAMPKILPTDLCWVDNGYFNGYDARLCPDRVTSIMRKGVVIWRRSPEAR